MKKRSFRGGFTLIEMLIVIAIIGILASIILIGLGPVQRRGRDARRQSDLREVQNALELYFNKCSHYPAGADGAACSGSGGTADWATMGTDLKGAGIGINQIPNDPSSAGGATVARNYKYGTDANGTTYVLQAVLEDTTNPALKDSLSSVPSGVSAVTCLSASGEYCLSL